MSLSNHPTQHPVHQKKQSTSSAFQDAGDTKKQDVAGEIWGTPEKEPLMGEVILLETRYLDLVMHQQLLGNSENFQSPHDLRDLPGDVYF